MAISSRLAWIAIDAIMIAFNVSWLVEGANKTVAIIGIIIFSVALIINVIAEIITRRR